MLAIAAWLNSAPIRALARLSAEPAANGYARYRAGNVGSVPLPGSALDSAELARIAGRGWSDTVAAELDELAAQHLGLTRVEREAIDAFIAAGG